MHNDERVCVGRIINDKLKYMSDLEKLANNYVDEKSDTDGFYDAFIAGYESALRIHDVVGRSEQLFCFDEKNKRIDRCANQCNTCKGLKLMQ